MNANDTDSGSLSPGRGPRLADTIVTWLVLTLPPAMVAAALLADARPGTADVLNMLAYYNLSMVGLTCGYHRHFSHGSFDAAPGVRAVLAFLGALAWEGKLVRWCALHRRHHQRADRDGDPHSARPRKPGVWGTVVALVRAQLLWMFRHERAFASRYARDLLDDALVTWMDAHYPVWMLASLVLPALTQALATGTLKGAWSGMLWGGFARIALVHWVSWMTNSIGHWLGTRPYPTPDLSRNNFVLAVLTWGEGWHNNHHMFGRSAVMGLRWYQPDGSAIVLAVLQRLGLIWNVRRPSPDAIAARRGRGAGATPSQRL